MLIIALVALFMAVGLTIALQASSDRAEALAATVISRSPVDVTHCLTSARSTR